MRPRRISLDRLLLAALLVLALSAGTVRAADPDALWKIVHDRCVPHATAGEGPAPCSFVDLPGGYAVLKDIRGATQFLLIPTARIAGIESPAILQPGAPNYWQVAWAARRFVDERAGRSLPRQDIGLAINAASQRSQNQLHIHIDCLRPDVITALAAKAAEIGAGWTPVALPPAGHPYLARRIDGPDLAGVDPFRLVAESLPGAAADMGGQTLVLAGAGLGAGQEGFYLLEDHVDPAQPARGWGEELLDHDCALLREKP
jgi:CDP-diacylglycerol pyrophosphatase